MAFFEHLEILPDDPILGLAARYAQDPRSQKMDLGVGIYKDAQGRTPVMAAVKQAEHWLVENQMSKAYTSTSESMASAMPWRRCCWALKTLKPRVRCRHPVAPVHCA